MIAIVYVTVSAGTRTTVEQNSAGIIRWLGDNPIDGIAGLTISPTPSGLTLETPVESAVLADLTAKRIATTLAGRPNVARTTYKVGQNAPAPAPAPAPVEPKKKRRPRLNTMVTGVFNPASGLKRRPGLQGGGSRNILIALYDNDLPLSSYQLADILEITPNTVMSTLQRLIKIGLVAKDPAPRKDPVKHYVITVAGKLCGPDFSELPSTRALTSWGGSQPYRLCIVQTLFDAGPGRPLTNTTLANASGASRQIINQFMRFAAKQGLITIETGSTERPRTHAYALTELGREIAETFLAVSITITIRAATAQRATELKALVYALTAQPEIEIAPNDR